MTDEKKQEFTLKVSQANRTQMIAIIYDIFLVYIEEAKKAHKENRKDEFRIAIKNARNCVQELIDSLQFEYELATGFMQLYLYINRELGIAETKNVSEPLDHISKIVEELKVAYTEAAKNDTSPSVMGNAQNVYAGLTYGKGKLNESMENPIENRGFRV